VFRGGEGAETGRLEGDDLVFRSEFTPGGTTFKLRNAMRIFSTGKMVSEEHMQTKDAPETLFVRVEAKKR
jgi:hypothetical protein